MILSVFTDILFWVGILLSLIGGIIIVASFATFKRRVIKTPRHENIEPKTRQGLPWGYILLFSGIALFFISYFLSVSYNK